jgi:PAS domain-containing protein
MWPHSVEMILARQLASYLTMPVFLIDPEGVLVFYNEPAELLLGLRFEETGKMTAGEWATTFEPLDEAGRPLPPDALPLMITLKEREPAHRTFRIRGKDGVTRSLQVTSFPLIGIGNRFVGAVAIFWEHKPE